MALQKPPIDAEATERRLRELLNEFIRGWFDGNEHPAPTSPVKFPECEPLFAVSEPQSDKPVIHFVITDRRPRHEWTDTSIRVKDACLMNVFIRVPNQGRSGNQADHLCGRIAELLKLVLETPALRADLTRKHILHPRVLRGPVPQGFPAHQCRFMVVGATLTYELPLAEA